MLTITIQVNAPPYTAQAIKEVLAMDLEKYGDTRVLSVVAEMPKTEQLRIGDRV